MIEKPLKKHGKNASPKPGNQVLNTLIQESHFDLSEFAKFADIPLWELQNYLYYFESPVAKNGKSFWKKSAKKLAAACGLTPEELFPVDSWWYELNDALTISHHAWCIKRWRETNVQHVLNKKDQSRMLFKYMMRLPNDYRHALVHWVRADKLTYCDSQLASLAIKRLRKMLFAKEDK